MFRIVSSKPKTKKEVRRERKLPDDEVVMNRSAIFSIYFTRSMLALCLVLLGALMGMKVSDYYWGRYWEKQEMRLAETKLGVLQAEQEIISSITPMPKPTPAPAAPAVDPLISPVVGANTNVPVQDPGVTITQPVIPEMPATPRAQPAPMTSQGNANFDQQLQALRAEREMLSRQFEHLNTGAAPDTLAQPAPNPPVIPRPAEPDPSVGGGPVEARPLPTEEIEMEDAVVRVTPAEQKIINAPALAKVANYNSDWQFIVLDGGSERNIRKGQKFAVRRGSEIICTVQVSDVDVSSATADLLGRAKNDPKSPKPQQGDDVIGYPLF